MLATYRKLRLVEDPKFTTRIELHSELVLLEWLLHGVHENNDEIIGDARELISQLADTLDATGLLPALREDALPKTTARTSQTDTPNADREETNNQDSPTLADSQGEEKLNTDSPDNQGENDQP